jgi:small nuclear ribonucleoprotein (snRNP)-like protein
MSGRPLDVLEATVGDRIVVVTKDGGRHAGRLGGYDQHLNLVLDPADGGPEGPEPVDSTTIIRGDTVASVEL